MNLATGPSYSDSDIQASSPRVRALAAVRAAPLDAGAALRLVVCIVDSSDALGGDGAFRHLLALDPGGVGWAAWGRLRLAQGDAAAARRLLRRAVTAAPTRAQAWSDFANSLQALKSPLATKAAARAAALVPGQADYLFNMGCERQDADKLDAAIRLFAWTRRLDPAHGESRGRAAMIACLRNALTEGENFIRSALACAPAWPGALNTRGLLCGRAGDRDGALRWFNRALRVAPNFAEAALNRSLERLQAGDLSVGWRDYDQRFASRGYVDRPLPTQRWRGEPLTGKSLFAWREQGVGDEVLFSSCLGDLAELAGTMVVECDRRLLGLFARSFPAVRFVAAQVGGPAGTYDFHTPLGSVPAYLRARLSDFPPSAAWLRPDAGLAARWRERLARLPPGLNVGLAWKSGLLTTERAAAYTALTDWAPLFAVSSVNIVNLQYGDCQAELAAAARGGAVIHGWDDLDLKDDLEQVAALTAGLDLVISPATAVGELAAALGTPVWRLGGLDWTTLGAAIRPWFPCQRLFAPRRGEALRDVSQRIAQELRRLARPRPPAESAASMICFDEALRLYQAGDFDRAAAACAVLIRQPSPSVRVRHLAAVVANRCGRPGDAVAALAPVATAAAADPAAAATLGAAFKALGLAATAADRPAAAVGFHRRALALHPADRAALVNVGAALTTLRHGDAARTALSRALALDAADAAAWGNLALAQEYADNIDAALAAYRQALTINPQHAVSHYNLALLLLARGVLREGWAEHDWRFATPQFAGQGKRFAAPLWRGENLAGKRLLIWREQGVGDEIMFASCYGDVLGRTGQIIIQCDRRLIGLFARSFPSARIVAADAPPPPHDAHVPAGSLPRRLRSELSRFSAGAAWLVVDPARAAFWRKRLDALGPGLKVGVAWRSGLITTGRAAAYIEAADWGPVLRTPGVRFVNLQYGDVGGDLEEIRRRFGVDVAAWDDLDLKNDFENTAALMSGLDLALTPATSAGELAAAVGTPVWRLATRDWTSLATGVRPWYAAMRVWPPRLGESLRDVPRAMARALAALALVPAAVSPPPPARNNERLLAEARAAFVAGRIAPAAAAFAAILAADPFCAAAWTGVGACLAENGGAAGAADALARALALSPSDAAALTTRGNALAALGRRRAAAAAHQWATRAAPGLPPVWDNLGVALLALGRDREAEACHRRAAAGDVSAAGPWINLAAALRHQGRFTEARAALIHALTLAPGDEDIFANLTRLLNLTEDRPLLNPWMARAHDLAPQSPAVAFNRGVALLAAGRLREGWAGYDCRFEVAELAFAAPRLNAPYWRGESLNGRRLLVWGEQGVGDQLLFASVLPDLIERAAREGGRVTAAPEPRLAGLFQSSFPQAEIVKSLEEVAGDVDFQCGAASPGRWLRRRLADFSSSRRAYLRPDPALAAAWRRRLAELPPGLRVGISWRSGLITGERRLEYTDLSAWRDLLRAPGVVAVNLLYGAEEEIASARRQGLRLYGWDDLDLKNDFAAVAGVISQLDLVISPASSVGELAAALGTPTWRFALPGDWTRLGTSVRPWLPAQAVFTPRPGENLNDVARRLGRRLSANPP